MVSVHMPLDLTRARYNMEYERYLYIARRRSPHGGSIGEAIIKTEKETIGNWTGDAALFGRALMYQGA